MTDKVLRDGERITALEVQVSHLLQEQQQMNQKLDELLGLRNKGIGAFWLVSALAGTGIIGISMSLLDWLRGVIHG